MDLPHPEAGMVISYSYLWQHEHNRGREEGAKNRPAVIVVASLLQPDGSTVVTVAPITRSKPSQASAAIEIPQSVKIGLRLDHERSWIIADEVNRFVWPGFDLRPVPGSQRGIVYGYIPPNLLKSLGAAVMRLVKARRLTVIPRD